jgi:hypothetical protein
LLRIANDLRFLAKKGLVTIPHCTLIPDRTTPQPFKVSITSQ